jgi:Tfp pilus assembly protein PilF
LKPGAQPKPSSRHAFVAILFSLLFISVVGLSIYLVGRNAHLSDSTKSNNKGKNANLATVQDEQKRFGKTINNNLKNGDVQSYQNAQLELANRYVNIGNFASAKNILQTVKQNVPGDKLSSYYFQVKLLVDEHEKNLASQRDDLKNLVKLLKANGQTTEAARYQKQLDKL